MSMAYSPGDKIFAKVKGHPHWPSRINLLPEDVPIPKGKYPIFFYGTHEVYFLAPKDIFPYEKFKHKYGVPRNKAVFQAGLREIEENPDVLLYKKDPEAETFLAQFYSFKRGCKDNGHNSVLASPTMEIQSQKRSKSTSAETEHGRPAKRPHTESRKSSGSVDHHSYSAQRDRRSSAIKCAKKSPNTTNSPVKSSIPSSDVAESDGFVPVDSQRVSALRLRIRKHSSVLMSPDSVSPSSPSTTGSTATLEARHGSEQSHTSSNDPLKIIIRQNTAISPLVSIEEKTKSRPVVSVTPTRSTANENHTNQSDTHRTRSTAVVTPLLRNVLPELSDDSSDSVASTNDVNLKTNNTDDKEKQSILEEKAARNNQDSNRDTYRTDSIRLRRRPAKQGRYSTEFIIFTNVKNSRKRSPSISPKLSSRSWEKSPMELTSKSVDVKTSSVVSSNSTVVQSNTMSTFNDQNIKDKEQQLKDLDAEERLLLIDRSIKSSLIQGHEDIATCVDRLEFLDKMTISLPIMARCWTVVETIRKCRRYKRSLEVKIAAQKVFNKFLQLYATADKNELDLAHAELIKHQQRHIKKHFPGFNKDDSLEETVSMSANSIPPYMGPKSMADLFQLTTRSTKSEIPDVKKTCHETGKSTSEILQSPSSVDKTPNTSQPLERFELSTVNMDTLTCVAVKSPTQHVVTTVCESKSHSSLHSPLKVGYQTDVSVQDIPLPEETPTQFISPKETAMNSTDVIAIGKDICEMPTGEDVEEEFELLDVYEEPEEPDDAAIIQQSDCKFPILQFSEPDNFVKTKSISLSATPEQAGFAVTPMPHVNCSSSATYMGAYHSHPVITNKSLYPYPIFPNVQIQNPFRNHGHLLTDYSSPSHSHLRQNVDATPPQSSSRAYIPHSLHPSEDPPPPYRPYIPTRCDPEQTQELGTSPDSSTKPRKELSQPSNITNNGAIQELTSTTKASNLNPGRLKVCGGSNNNNISRETRTPPHRGRSPHALPHPLEHYQRYLNSALNSEDETSKNDTSKQFTDRPLETHDTLPNNQSSLNASKTDKVETHISPVNDNLHNEMPFVSPSAEDLDTRIARLYDLAMRKNSITVSNTAVDISNENKSQKPTANPIISPPPPPPPLPTSQRILFTHRPQNPIHSNISKCLTPLSSSQQELRLSSHKINDNNRNLENNTGHRGPTNRSNQISSSSLHEQIQYLPSGSHPSGPDNIVINPNISCEMSFKVSEQQTRNIPISDSALGFSGNSLDSIRPATHSYPRRPLNNHSQSTRYYPVNPAHNYQTTPTTHPHFQRSNSNRMKLNSDPLLSGRRHSDRDDDRDIYSMLGV
ncbi:unnamed protein product [Schistosoma intercalatum]|nr:unnamed protein product [Schistosoma intercalatum]CAH8482746.1 unnamed protein product [Schistosoma intercalatum]